jgi:uncharacterized protein (TIGR02996 family)
MNADREAFVREIAEHPGDDAPRLIFADWLEERDDPQGQFIRLQCELERTSDRERRNILIRRETDMLREHRDDWLRPFGGALVRGVFRRGMLDQAEVESQAFLQHAGQWFRQFPLKILQLNLRDIPLDKLAGIRELRQIRSLRVGGSRLLDGDCIRLLGAANIGALEELWLSSNQLGPQTLRWLTSSPLRMSLRVLILSGNELGNEGRDILVNGPPFPNLLRLYISSCAINRRAVPKIQKRHPNLQGISCT